MNATYEAELESPKGRQSFKRTGPNQSESRGLGLVGAGAEHKVTRWGSGVRLTAGPLTGLKYGKGGVVLSRMGLMEQAKSSASGGQVA